MSKMDYPSGLERRVSGDWICSFCKNLNYSFRLACNRCKSEKPQSLFNSALFLLIDGHDLMNTSAANNWDGFFNEHISAKPITSTGCKTQPKIVHHGETIHDSTQIEDILSRVKRPNSAKPGDWVCLYCYNLNFAFRNSCNKCHQLKNSFISL